MSNQLGYTMRNMCVSIVECVYLVLSWNQRLARESHHQDNYLIRLAGSILHNVDQEVWLLCVYLCR